MIEFFQTRMKMMMTTTTMSKCYYFDAFKGIIIFRRNSSWNVEPDG